MICPGLVISYHSLVISTASFYRVIYFFLSLQAYLTDGLKYSIKFFFLFFIYSPTSFEREIHDKVTLLSSTSHCSQPFSSSSLLLQHNKLYCSNGSDADTWSWWNYTPTTNVVSWSMYCLLKTSFRNVGAGICGLSKTFLSFVLIKLY